jgi:DNA-binding response OmpR family regulator
VRRLRALIVEDEFIVAYELGQLLESMGHEVCRVVGSGDQALKAARADRPDCVLMDVNIRGPIDGTVVAAEIRRELGAAIVFLTGLPVREVGRRVQGLTPAAVLTKPIDRQELRAVLDAVAAGGRAEGSPDTGFDEVASREAGNHD